MLDDSGRSSARINPSLSAFAAREDVCTGGGASGAVGSDFGSALGADFGSEVACRFASALG